MILKALYDYYNRSDDSVPFGYKYVQMSFVLVISKDGKLLGIEDYRDENGKGKECLVPNGDHKNGLTPMLFYDNPQYLLDYSDQEDTKKRTTAHRKHLSFVERCKKVADKSQDGDLMAVCKFYENGELCKVSEDPLWNDITKNPHVWLTFRIDGHAELVVSKSFLLDFNDDDNPTEGRCLVTGKRQEIVRICTPTPIRGSQSSAKLVSYNDESYCSYGKEQGENATISKEADFAFSSALKALTAKGSRNKFEIGSRIYLFWASSKDATSRNAEEALYTMFGATEDDDPNKRIELACQVFKDIFSGKRPVSDEDKFYFLGITAPNPARIAVVYWNECKLKDFARIILRHFDDMEIIDTRSDDKKRPYQGLHQMMGAVTLSGKSSDVQPNLPDATIKSILQGLPYPVSLVQACIRRVRAEQDISPYGSPCRVAILKAYLNRINDNNKKIEVMLDKQNDNVGYLCGRLFATIEKIQEEANNIHNVRDRYLNAASSAPSTVFATLLNLSQHHLEKLSQNRQIFFQKTEQEIIGILPADGFPSHLDLNDQGRFFVGYYHQRQDFFTSKEDKEETEKWNNL